MTLVSETLGTPHAEIELTAAKFCRLLVEGFRRR
jgi:hypothetical protein